MVRPRRHIRRYAAPYLVRMIKPNLIASHDWHVQPFCQRSLRLIRLSGAVWIEAQTVTPECPRTCCARRICVLQHLPAFLREPFKITKLSPSSQARSFLRLRPLKLVVGGQVPRCEFRPTEKGKVTFKSVAQRKISKSGQQNAPEPIGLAGVQLLGRAMACSLRDSLQGFRGTRLRTSPDPTNQLPTSLNGAGQTATGRLHCSSRTSKE